VKDYISLIPSTPQDLITFLNSDTKSIMTALKNLNATTWPTKLGHQTIYYLKSPELTEEKINNLITNKFSSYIDERHGESIRTIQLLIRQNPLTINEIIINTGFNESLVRKLLIKMGAITSEKKPFRYSLPN